MKNTENKFLLWLVIAIIAGFIFALITNRWAAKAEAKPCKSENAECNVNDSNKLCCPGLVCMDKGVPSDAGKCQLQATPTPIPPTPTKEPDEKIWCHRWKEDICEEKLEKKCKKDWDEGRCETEPTPTPEVTPEPTPEPVQPSRTVDMSIYQPDCPYDTCPAVCIDPIKPALAVTGKRIDTDTIVFNWWPSTDSHDKQVLRYGLTPDNLPYSVLDIPAGVGSYEVNGLTGDHWFYQVGVWKGECISWSNVTDP